MPAEYNPAGITGTVVPYTWVDSKSQHWVQVEWDNGLTNHYPIDYSYLIKQGKTMSNHTPEAMTAAQALDHLERIKAVTPRKMDAVLSVEVYAPGTVGGSPTVPVIGLGLGLDWDSGKLIIRPEKPLTQLTLEQVEAIGKSVREGNSWHAYERYKQHKAREKELVDQLATITAQRNELLAASSAVLKIWDEIYPDMKSGKYPQSVLEGIEF